jgi:hypothetical protein
MSNGLYWQPAIRCKNAYCARGGSDPIPLPYPNPPQTNIHQPDWPPEGWQITVVCPSCSRQVECGTGESGKTKVDWLHRKIPLECQSDLVFWKVELQCAHEDCESRAILHTEANSAAKWGEVIAAVRRAEPPLVCTNKHSLVDPRTIVLFLRRVHSV